MDYPALLTRLTQGEHLAEAEMQAMMHGIFSGEWSPAQTAAALIALKIKGETPAEIAAAAGVMREFAARVDGVTAEVVDTCGTGGDGGRTFNISTTAAFVAAACGVPIAKHGNRAMSGASGSSDVLDALGLPLDVPPPRVAALINTTGIGFMFAPNHHAAMKHAVPVRRDLGVRTLFNLLGPLTNPAGARRQVVGVFDKNLLLPYAETLGLLGAVHAMVVHGGGLDEISISEETDIAEWKDGAVVRTTFAPEDAGLQRAPLEEIQITSVEEAKAMLLAVLDGKAGAARDIVLLNAAAALVVGGKAENIPAGVEIARDAINSGAARAKLDAFLQAAQQPE